MLLLGGGGMDDERAGHLALDHRRRRRRRRAVPRCRRRGLEPHRRDHHVGVLARVPTEYGLDPTVHLRSGGRLEVFSDAAFDTWTINTPSVVLVGPLVVGHAGGPGAIGERSSPGRVNRMSVRREQCHCRRATAPPSANNKRSSRRCGTWPCPTRPTVAALLNQLMVESILIVPLAGSHGRRLGNGVRVGPGRPRPRRRLAARLHQPRSPRPVVTRRCHPRRPAGAGHLRDGRAERRRASRHRPGLGSVRHPRVARHRRHRPRTGDRRCDDRAHRRRAPVHVRGAHRPPPARGRGRGTRGSSPRPLRSCAPSSPSARQGAAAPEVAVVLVPAADVARGGASDEITRSVAAAAMERAASTASWLFIVGDDELERALAEGAGAELYRR